MRTAIGLTFIFAMTVLTAAYAQDTEKRKPQGMTIRLELFVTNMEKSIDFYSNVLGFEKVDGESDYVPVRSGSVLIGLGLASGLPKPHHFNPEVQKDRRGLGTEIVLEVDDVKSYFEKVKATGYKGKLSPLRRQSWGLTDFRIVDPDGYYLRITSR